MYCENCGVKIPENETFCPECGKELSKPGPIEGTRDVFEDAPEVLPEKDKARQMSAVRMIAYMAVLIFIAVIIYKLLR